MAGIRRETLGQITQNPRELNFDLRDTRQAWYLHLGSKKLEQQVTTHFLLILTGKIWKSGLKIAHILLGRCNAGSAKLWYLQLRNIPGI
jgi:hypothetical protein